MSAGNREFSVAMRLLLEAQGIKPGAQAAKKELTEAASAGAKGFEKVDAQVTKVGQTIAYKLGTSLQVSQATFQKMGMEGTRTFSSWTQGANNAYAATDRLTNSTERARRNLRGIREEASSTFRFLQDSQRRMGSLFGMLGFAGAGYGAFRLAAQSGRLDQDTTRVMQTADATPAQRDQLRKDLFALSRRTGRPIDELLDVQNTFVQAGLDWGKASAATSAVAPAMAVSGASGQGLARGLVTASNLYGYDLSKPGVAAMLLDQMRAAGKAGNAEMEQMSDILPRVAPKAREAGMDFSKTLSFVEMFSQIVPEPEKLATLSESTLRLWSTFQYRARMEQLTGTKFFDAKGATREPASVLADLIGFASKGKTPEERANRLGAMFYGMDQDTATGAAMLIQDPKKLDKMDSIAAAIANSRGMVESELPGSMDNIDAQSGRLKASMRQAADAFAQPINSVLKDLIKWSQDTAKMGPMATTASTLAVAAGAVGAGTLLAAGARRLRGGLFASAAGTAVGIAEGKALQMAAGVTPVFVTNWPGGGSSGGGDLATGVVGGAVAGRVIKGLPAAVRLLRAATVADLFGGALGLGGASIAGAGLLGAGAVGYGVGSVIHSLLPDDLSDKIGHLEATLLALFGDRTARSGLERESRAKLELTIKDGGAAVTGFTSSGGLDLSVYGAWLLNGARP
ncbi:MAG TPA: phage tail tape measure protein [Nevskiaceae bacterium]|nr:phage tail tape measure protein [Nevskiaceae bacterium]